MANNKSLQRAKNDKNDEFYTQLSDIQNEVSHYVKEFEGKTVICNCDDPRVSNFVVYFALNFKSFKLKRLIATCYKSQNPDLFSQHDSETALYLDYDGSIPCNSVQELLALPMHPLKGDGDFRSEECLALLDQADIVCTNPPFSLFREYVDILISHQKKFLVIGNQNNITYKEVIAHIMNGRLWTGYNYGEMEFSVPDYYEPKAVRYRQDETGQKWRSFGNICWYTNLPMRRRYEELITWKSYDPDLFPKYDNYDAIEVCPYKDIPINYYGKMGVPVTFVNSYNPNQFEILGIDRYIEDNPIPNKRFTINGQEKQGRIVIRRIKK